MYNDLNRKVLGDTPEDLHDRAKLPRPSGQEAANMTTEDSSNVKMPTAYNGTTLEVLWGIAIILKYDPFAKIAATQNTIRFGAYYTKSLMTEDEQISMDSWGWEKQGESYIRKV